MKQIRDGQLAMRVQENAPIANIRAYMRQYADVRIDTHQKKSGAWPSLIQILE